MMLCERHNVMYLSSCNKCQSESADTIEKLTKERDKLVEALKFHQEQTRPIDKTESILAEHKEQA